MKRTHGFTTIELIVVIALFAILVGIAIPGFSRWLPNYRLRAAARDMFSNFQHAKLTAVKKYRTCAITFNQDIGGTVHDYVVYVDNDDDLEFDDPGDEVLTSVLFSERYKGVSFDTTKGGGDGIEDSIINNDDANPTIGFLSNGFSVDNAGDPASGSVFLINLNGRERELAVSAAGNITIIE
jgi:prepilin-type N-terminal cleavage/methylation domain-containing protein